MKSHAITILLLWLIAAIELAFRDVVPHGSLLIPIECAAMCWLRSAVAIAVCGSLLLLDWIARPTLWPLCPMLLPMLTSYFIAGSTGSSCGGEQRSSRLEPLHVPLLTIAGVLLQQCSNWSLSSLASPQELLPHFTSTLIPTLLIALPVSAVASLMIRTADEFGLRRSWELVS